jgi:hypothetical protein
MLSRQTLRTGYGYIQLFSQAQYHVPEKEIKSNVTISMVCQRSLLLNVLVSPVLDVLDIGFRCPPKAADSRVMAPAASLESTLAAVRGSHSASVSSKGKNLICSSRRKQKRQDQRA